MGGLSSVAVAPEHRGRGLGMIVCRAALRDMGVHGESISSLYPGTTLLYRRLGWELAGAAVIRRIRLRALRSFSVSPPGRVRRASRDDLDAMKELYARLSPEINGFLDRAPFSWGFLDYNWDDHYAYLALGAAGELEGYVVYDQLSMQDGALDFTLRVRDFVALNRDAATALWWTLGSSSTQAGEVDYHCSPEDALLLLLEEQEVTVRADVRWMLRIVDAPRRDCGPWLSAGLRCRDPVAAARVRSVCGGCAARVE